MSYPVNKTGYMNVPPGGNPRATEAWALTETARRMSEAQREGAPIEQLLGAVRLNWRLWTIFQAEISDDSCPLATEIRENMLSLSNFVDKTCVDIISDPTPKKLDILISINRNLAAGLFETPPQDAAAESQAGEKSSALGTGSASFSV